MTQPIEVGLPQKGKADGVPFAQIVGENLRLNPLSQDILEEAAGILLLASDAHEGDFAYNPLAAYPPKASGPLPPGSGQKIFTLADAIAALGKFRSANTLAIHGDSEVILSENNQIIQLELRMRGAQQVQKDIQHAIEKEEHKEKILGFVETAIFGSLAIAFAFTVAGPAGGIAAAMAVGVNTTLEETHTYAKMTKHLSPTDALLAKLGIAIVVGAVAGLGTAGGITAIDALTSDEAESIAANLGIGKSAAEEEASSLADDAAAVADEVPATGLGPNEFEMVEMAESRIANDADEEAAGALKKSTKEIGKQDVAKAKSNEPAGNVKARTLQMKKRSLWMALTSFQNVATGSDSKSKGEKSAHNLFGDIFFAIAKDSGDSDKKADEIAGWGQTAMGVALTVADYYTGSSLMGGEAAESTEQLVSRLGRVAGQAINILTAAGQVGTSTFQAVQGFKMSGQYEHLADLSKTIADIDKDTQEAQWVVDLFSGALKESSALNRDFMSTVFGVVQDINTAFGAAAGANAA